MGILYNCTLQSLYNWLVISTTALYTHQPGVLITQNAKRNFDGTSWTLVARASHDPTSTLHGSGSIGGRSYRTIQLAVCTTWINRISLITFLPLLPKKIIKTYPINHISWEYMEFLDSPEFPSHVSVYVGTGVVQVTQMVGLTWMFLVSSSDCQ